MTRRHEAVGHQANTGEAVLTGAMLIIFAAGFLALADAVVKLNNADFSVWQIFVLRGVIAVPLLLVLLTLRRASGSVWPHSPGWVALRSLCLTLAWITYYAALPLIDLSVAAVGFYTAPLFIALPSALTTGEKVGLRQWVGIGTGFAGVVIILRPDSGDFSPAVLLPVFSAFCYALTALITRSRCRAERPLVLSLGLNVTLLLVGALASLLVMLLGPAIATAWPSAAFLSDGWHDVTAEKWLLVGFLTIAIVVPSIAVSRAYQSGPAAIIGTFDYSYLIFAAIWAYIFFTETPDAATIAGALLIFCAGLLVIWPSRKSAHRAAAS